MLTGTNKRLFVFGVSLTFFILISLSAVLVVNQDLFLRVIGTILASVAGGRSAAILTGLELRLGAVSISIIVFLINLAWLCTLLPLLIAFYNNVTEIKFIGKFLYSTKQRAQAQKSKVALWGSWALPLFIWLPFPFTGSFAGAIIGFLLGIPMRRLLTIVIGSMFVGIVSWTYGFDYFIFLTGKTGKIITYSIIGGIIVHTFVRNLPKRKQRQRPKPIKPINPEEL